jgi:hypothetical protein
MRPLVRDRPPCGHSDYGYAASETGRPDSGPEPVSRSPATSAVWRCRPSARHQDVARIHREASESRVSRLTIASMYEKPLCVNKYTPWRAMEPSSPKVAKSLNVGSCSYLVIQGHCSQITTSRSRGPTQTPLFITAQTGHLLATLWAMTWPSPHVAKSPKSSQSMESIAAHTNAHQALSSRPPGAVRPPGGGTRPRWRRQQRQDGRRVSAVRKTPGRRGQRRRDQRGR